MSESKRGLETLDDDASSQSDLRASQARIPHRLQKAKIADAMNMVERECVIRILITKTYIFHC